MRRHPSRLSTSGAEWFEEPRALDGSPRTSSDGIELRATGVRVSVDREAVHRLRAMVYRRLAKTLVTFVGVAGTFAGGCWFMLQQ